MGTFGKITLVGAILVLLVGSIIGIKCIGWNNQEVDLRNSFVAQEKDSHLHLDNMWKIIKQQAKVSDRYADKFKEIYVSQADARHENGGALFKMINESNPQFDSSMYKNLMNSIESHRLSFKRSQSLLLDLKRSHDNLRMKFPSSLVCGSAQPLEVNLITSSNTKRMIETGEENDIEIFD